MKSVDIRCENHGSKHLSRRMIRSDLSGWVCASSYGSRKILGFQIPEHLMQNHMVAQGQFDKYAHWIVSVGS